MPYTPKTQQFILVLCEQHESETSPSTRNFAMYQSPTVVSRGHPGFPFDATCWGVGVTEHINFRLKIMSIAASTFHGCKGG